MKKIAQSEILGNENQMFLRLVHHMWKKVDLLRQITLECTSIFPAKTNPHFSKRAQIKICNLGYELAENYRQLKHSDQLLTKLNNHTNDLCKMWKDANTRGYAPLTETKIILFLIKDLKKDLQKIGRMYKTNRLENAI
ncbi:MAG: hypothetical protein LAT54_04430 [Cryomorphaceae bacterium]|nr:hypothetical protein [Cryomorphaceae bacterium]